MGLQGGLPIFILRFGRCRAHRWYSRPAVCGCRRTCSGQTRHASPCPPRALLSELATCCRGWRPGVAFRRGGHPEPGVGLTRVPVN